MTALIYSKADCVYCEKAKSLLTTLNLAYEEKNVSEPDTRQELLLRVPNAKTVPQIFINGVYVGGYTELLELTDSIPE
jgi:glutaredoxin 3